tara:strand:- start:2583 stop:3437 length:855 start_codon:yes stop_codon:yes gene_type:complete
MVIPARWMATGLGLNDFREDMLNDERIRSLTIFDVSKEVFPSVEVKGGICYFLWQEETKGKCAVTNVRDGIRTGPNLRVLNDFDIFVRNNESLKILDRVLNKEEDSITSILSVDKEFGWTSNYKDFSQSKRKGHVPLYYIRNGKRFVGYKNRKEVDKSADLIDCWKVLIPAAGSDGGQRIPDYVLGKSLIAGSPSVCTQSYLFFKLNTQDEAESMQSYLTTRFFRFLVSLRKITQHATKSTYTWVPMQTWDRVWTDEQLFDKYKLSKRQITHIENLISPVELND